MTDSPVTWLRPGTGPGYSEIDALNDIHALLTGTGIGAGTDRELLGDIGAIVTRTGRVLVPVRDIDACVTESPHGRPAALVDAAGTTVTVRQEPAGTGLLVEITGTGLAGAAGDTTVTLDGRCLHHPCPPGGHAA
jgi:hypothetical protein